MKDVFRIEQRPLSSGKTYSRAIELLDKIDAPTQADLDQLISDLRHHGTAIVKDGKRIDPAKFFGEDDPSNKTPK